MVEEGRLMSWASEVIRRLHAGRRADAVTCCRVRALLRDGSATGGRN